MTEEENGIQRLQGGDVAARREAADLLGAIGGTRAVDPLLQALRDEDWGVRVIAEHALWEVWCRSGDRTVDALLQAGIQAMDRKAWTEAVTTFTLAIEKAPEFAEAYNKRATTHYLLGDYTEAIIDCEATLARNPYHFGALSGAGLCYLARGELHKARGCFQRALAINPNMPEVGENLAAVERSLHVGGNGSDE